MDNDTVSEFSPGATSFSESALQVPNEILLQIFLQALGTLPSAILDNPDLNRKAEKILAENAFRTILRSRLAAVCRRWRYLALSIGELSGWVGFGPGPHSTRILDQAYLKNLLWHSNYAPLDIFIDVTPSLRDAWTAGAEGVCTTLMDTADRWRFLCVQMPPLAAKASAAALLSRRAPVLEGLIVGHSGQRNCWFSRNRAHERNMGVITVTLASPKLRRIEFAYLTLQPLLLETPTTLRALVYLSLDHVKLRPDALWCMLDSAQNLKTLCLVRIRSTATTPWHPPSGAHLQLHHLSGLELSCSDPAEDFLAQWAPHLDLPCLEFLDLDGVSPQDLLALAPCVGASVTKLSYQAVGARPGLAPAFAALPRVRELIFGPCGVVPEPALIRSMADGAVFPVLECLSLYGVELVWRPRRYNALGEVEEKADADEDHAKDDGHVEGEAEVEEEEEDDDENDEPDADKHDEYDDDFEIPDQADEARACARALLDLAIARNSPAARQDADHVPGRPVPPPLEHILFDESELDERFAMELQKYVTLLP